MSKEDKTIFYSGRKDEIHKHGVGLVVSKDILVLSQLKEYAMYAIID